MKGINKVILVATLGNDPETKYTAGGSAITTVSAATNESWKDKETGEVKERAEWHRIKFFGRLAEIAGEYLKKGRQIYVEGSLRTDKYTDKNGIERYTTEIIANELQMLGGGNRDEAGGGEGRPQGAAQRGGQSQQQGQRGGGPVKQHGGQGGGGRQVPQRQPSEDFVDDDVPFAHNRGNW
jgi:single-strand DNA-binding protein